MSNKFQSTLPRRERPRPCRVMQGESEFQSTLPRRERQEIRLLGIVPGQFQSTLPRRERQHVKDKHIEGAKISIHAPAKGATDSIMLP